MPRIRILPYKQGSVSARELANALDTLNLKLENSRFRQRRSDVIINWGNNNPPTQFIPTINGHLGELRAATNKLEFFRRLETSLYVPEFWTLS